MEVTDKVKRAKSRKALILPYSRIFLHGYEVSVWFVHVDLIGLAQVHADISKVSLARYYSVYGRGSGEDGGWGSGCTT
jgi:hypothetical protein